MAGGRTASDGPGWEGSTESRRAALCSSMSRVVGRAVGRSRCGGAVTDPCACCAVGCWAAGQGRPCSLCKALKVLAYSQDDDDDSGEEGGYKAAALEGLKVSRGEGQSLVLSAPPISMSMWGAAVLP